MLRGVLTNWADVRRRRNIRSTHASSCRDTCGRRHRCTSGGRTWYERAIGDRLPIDDQATRGGVRRADPPGAAGDGVDSDSGNVVVVVGCRTDWNQEMSTLAQQLCVDDVILHVDSADLGRHGCAQAVRRRPGAARASQTDAGRCRHPAPLHASSTPGLGEVAARLRDRGGLCPGFSERRRRSGRDDVGMARSHAPKPPGARSGWGLCCRAAPECRTTRWMSKQTEWSKEVADSDLWSCTGKRIQTRSPASISRSRGTMSSYSTDPAAGVAYTRYANLLDYTKTVSAHVRSLAGDGVEIMTSPYHVAFSYATGSKQTMQHRGARDVSARCRGNHRRHRGDGLRTAGQPGRLLSDPAAAAAWMAAARLGVSDAHSNGSDVELWGNIEQYDRSMVAGHSPSGSCWRIWTM